MSRKEEMTKLQDSLQRRQGEIREALKQEPMTARSVTDDLSAEAQITEQLEVEFGINAVESLRLVEISEALDKMKKGTYGVCEECEKEISIGRLQAIPHAARCVQCQSELEAKSN